MALRYDPDHINTLARDIRTNGEEISEAAKVPEIETDAGEMPAAAKINLVMKNIENAMKQYGALMGETDTQIGKMMENLRKADNTSGG